eukprot:COSAG02_NODE_271_length_26364_cov_13.423018_15_plen_110_part_00
MHRVFMHDQCTRGSTVRKFTWVLLEFRVKLHGMTCTVMPAPLASKYCPDSRGVWAGIRGAPYAHPQLARCESLQTELGAKLQEVQAATASPRPMDVTVVHAAMTCATHF